MFDFGDQDTSLPPNMDGKDTPPDLEVSSAIRFVQSDLQTMSDGEELVRIIGYCCKTPNLTIF